MVPAFIEVVQVGNLEPTLLNTAYIAGVEPNFSGGCRLTMSTGNILNIVQEYITIFEELQ